MTKLVKCPFCARSSAGTAVHQVVPHKEFFFVQCDNCEACGPTADTREEAEALWNHRQDVDDRGALDVSGTR
jgi:C4-type Zn-finger protein